MSLGIKALSLVAIGLFLLTYIIDIFINNKMIEDNYSTVRTANENSLAMIKDEEEITDLVMLNNWITNFIEENNMTFEELKIDILSLGSNPPHYVVYIKGFNKYAMLSEELYSRFENSAAIIESAINQN